MKILCIDGNSILNRAYYGIKLLTTKNGVHTNGIYGFLNIILSIEKTLNPDAVMVAFDLPKKTFRHDKYTEYKGTRKKMPDELRGQFPILKDILNDLGYKIVEVEGYEADDVLGTFSKYCGENKHHCVIATGDKDNLQLIDEFTTVMLATTKNGTGGNAPIIDEKKYIEDYGVTPKQLVDVKALMGDASDNIPGVTGIGEKTAYKLISEYGSLDNVYNNLEDKNIIKPKAKQNLINDKENAYLSQFLATIFCDIPLDCDINKYVKDSIKSDNVRDKFIDLEMFSFLSKFNIDENVEDEQKDIVNCIFNSDNLKLLDNEDVNLYIDNDFFSVSQNDTIYLFNNDLFNKNLLTVILEKHCVKVFKSKELFKYCLENKINFKHIAFDCEIAAYLDNPNNSGYEISKLFVQYGINSNIDIEENKEHFCKHLSFVKLCEKLSQLIKDKDLNNLFYNIEMPLAEVLADMEIAGIYADKEDIVNFGENLKITIDTLTTEIYELSGEEFNINSPKQLGVILFEKLQLPHNKKGKTGYSTNADVLDFLRDKHSIIDLILKYRTYTKLKSTYVDGLLKVISSNGKIYTTFNQIETRTGRISSIEPNMQNIPVRTELGSQMRKFFKASEGYVFVDADYSQIELRVLAHMACDKNMINAFETGEDIHLNTASQVFNLPKDMVTSEMRSAAKAVNFGIVYGISGFSLSKDIKSTVNEANSYIENYLNTFVGVKDYMDNCVKFAEENGYVITLFNRRRSIPEIQSGNKNIKSFGKRVAMNMPIQGTAADIIKMSMINVYKRLKAEDLPAKLILQVHDELIVECKENVKDIVSKILKEEMEKAATLAVNLDVDVNIGYDWYTAKG
ncbi:MAG: DNA polymerase I [Oscillospiraceae bacterium]